MSKSISFEEAKEKLFNKHGNNIVFIEYKNSHAKAIFQCMICRRIWTAKANSVWSGNGCSECRDKRLSEKYRIPFNEVKKYIENRGCRILISENEYINSKEKINILFECGHIHPMTFECFKRGQECPCKAQFKFKKSIEEKTRKKVFDIILSLGFSFISFENDFANYDFDVTYLCNNGHTETRNIGNFLSKKTCTICSKINFSESQKGNLANNWQGGKTKLAAYFRDLNLEWIKKSTESCGYKCIITGDRFNDIHHLYPVNKMLNDALSILGLDLKDSIGEYEESVFRLITEEILKIQNNYPLGVCLRKDIHKLFHKLYGLTRCIPEDFYEFVDRINCGEIQIPN